MITIKKAMEYLFYALVVTYFVGKLFEPITMLIGILFCVYLYKNPDEAKQMYEKYRYLALSFLFLYLYFIPQSMTAGEPLDALRSSLGSLRFVLLVFAAIVVFDSEKRVKRLIYFSFIGVGIVSLDSLYQYFTGVDIFGFPYYGGGARLTAWHDAPKVNVMMGQFFGLLICAPLILSGNKKIVAIVVLCLASIVFILAGNRSPILALFTSILFVSLFIKHKKYLFISLVGLVLVFAYALSTERMGASLQALFDPSSPKTTSKRIPISLTAIEMIKENPLFGIGAKNFDEEFQKYYAKVDFENRYKHYFDETLLEITTTHVHNPTLDILVSYGLIGFLLFLYILYNIYVYFIKSNQFGIIASIGLLYCITPLQFSRAFTQSEWQFITYLSLVFLVALSGLYSKQKRVD